MLVADWCGATAGGVLLIERTWGAWRGGITILTSLITIMPHLAQKASEPLAVRDPVAELRLGTARRVLPEVRTCGAWAVRPPSRDYLSSSSHLSMNGAKLRLPFLVLRRLPLLSMAAKMLPPLVRRLCLLAMKTSPCGST